jgi:hypothetical protein
MRLLSRATDLEGFWTALGYQAEQQQELDLSAGKDQSEAAKILGRELQIRLGNTAGTPNPELHRFFNTRNKLNVQGLKVISGDCGI